MKDERAQKTEMLKLLEGALALSVELGQPVTEYLIERAIDEARARDGGRMPELGDFHLPKQ